MSKENQNLYEGMYIISSTLSDDTRSKALERIKAGITSHGGEILKIHEWGRRRLTYEIKGHREGYYYILYFKVNPSAIDEMWKEYHLNEDLIRFFTNRADEVMEEIKFKPLAEIQ